MSFVPPFEAGVLNVWIFMVAWVFFHMAPLDWPIFRYDIRARFRKGGASPSYTGTEKVFNNLSTIVWVIMFIYSVFIPLPLGTPLLYAGIAVFAVGLIIVWTAGIPWATAPENAPVTEGIYRYSRHPVYIGVFVQYIGIGIASASGLFLLLVLIQIALSIAITPAEERFCLEKYGNAYRDYIANTPRWMGIRGSH
jgi:protein-S-isoprenylcysteine O-methyltransferase Ste14